jgi:hypothetical protein
MHRKSLMIWRSKTNAGNQGLFVHFPKTIRVRSAAIASPLQRIDENLQPNENGLIPR